MNSRRKKHSSFDVIVSTLFISILVMESLQSNSSWEFKIVHLKCVFVYRSLCRDVMGIAMHNSCYCPTENKYACMFASRILFFFSFFFLSHFVNSSKQFFFLLPFFFSIFNQYYYNIKEIWNSTHFQRENHNVSNNYDKKKIDWKYQSEAKSEKSKKKLLKSKHIAARFYMIK